MAREHEELASIDELLAIGDEPEPEAAGAPPGRAAGGASWLFRSILLAVVGAGAVYVVLLPLGVKVPSPLLFSVFFALIAVRRALRVVAAPRLTVGAMPAAPAIGGVDPAELSDGIRFAV